MGTSKCVLVVDDDEEIRELVVEALHQGGYEVRQAVNGKDALSQLETMEGRPCLVLVDMAMPEMNGTELMEAMAETQKLAALPVVMVTGSAKECRGARRLLRKPVPPEILLGVVEEYCGAA